jgi:hypothetical protein
MYQSRNVCIYHQLYPKEQLSGGTEKGRKGAHTLMAKLKYRIKKKRELTTLHFDLFGGMTDNGDQIKLGCVSVSSTSKQSQPAKPVQLAWNNTEERKDFLLSKGDAMVPYEEHGRRHYRGGLMNTNQSTRRKSYSCCRRSGSQRRSTQVLGLAGETSWVDVGRVPTQRTLWTGMRPSYRYREFLLNEVAMYHAAYLRCGIDYSFRTGTLPGKFRSLPALLGRDLWV